MLLVPDFGAELARFGRCILHELVAVFLLVPHFLRLGLSFVLLCELDAVLLELKKLLLFPIVVKVLMLGDMFKRYPASLLAQSGGLLESLLLDRVEPLRVLLFLLQIQGNRPLDLSEIFLLHLMPERRLHFLVLPSLLPLFNLASSLFA